MTTDESRFKATLLYEITETKRNFVSFRFERRPNMRNFVPFRFEQNCKTGFFVSFRTFQENLLFVSFRTQKTSFRTTLILTSWNSHPFPRSTQLPSSVSWLLETAILSLVVRSLTYRSSSVSSSTRAAQALPRFSLRHKNPKSAEQISRDDNVSHYWV